MTEKTIKCFAIHDLDGNISGVVTAPADGPNVTTPLDLGFTLTEVEAPELVKAIGDQDKQRVDQLIENSRVEDGRIIQRG